MEAFLNFKNKAVKPKDSSIKKERLGHHFHFRPKQQNSANFRVIPNSFSIFSQFPNFPNQIVSAIPMAKIARTYRVVRLDGSNDQRLAPTKEELEEVRLQDYQQMYIEVELAQATRPAEALDSSSNADGLDNEDNRTTSGVG